MQRIIYRNPQFTVSISELEKYNRNKRKYWLDNGKFGDGC